MRNVLSYIGVLILIAGVSLIIPIPAAVILGEMDMVFPFALTRIQKTELDLSTAFIVTAQVLLTVFKRGA